MSTSFLLNGQPVEADGHPMARLLDVLREQLGRTGTKEGCGEGECGACTPGIVVTLAALLERNETPSREEAREALAGNLCRCTGYEGILRALLPAEAER